MTKADLTELENASTELVKWYREHCNPHMAIIIDTEGIRVISEECGIPIELIK